MTWKLLESTEMLQCSIFFYILSNYDQYIHGVVNPVHTINKGAQLNSNKSHMSSMALPGHTGF